MVSYTTIDKGSCLNYCPTQNVVLERHTESKRSIENLNFKMKNKFINAERQLNVLQHPKAKLS